MRHTLTSLADLPALGKALRTLDYSKAWAVDVKPAKDVRTQKQNRHYWQCVVGGFVRWQEAQGRHLDKEAVHAYLKLQRWGRDVVIAGERVRYADHGSRGVSVKEFGEYVDWATAHLIDELGMPPEYMEDRE